MRHASITTALVDVLRDPEDVIRSEAVANDVVLTSGAIAIIRKAYLGKARSKRQRRRTNDAPVAVQAAPTHAPQTVMPLFAGPKNAEALFGHSWRWLRDFAFEHDVPIIPASTKGDPKRGKTLIPVTALVAAIERFQNVEPAAEGDEDELERFRRAIGKTKK